MQCAQCGEANPDHAKFCIECGTPFAARCPACAAENPARAKFCASCGTALVGKAKVKRQRAKGKKKDESLNPNPRSPASYTPPHLAERIRAAAITDERKTITA